MENKELQEFKITSLIRYVAGVSIGFFLGVQATLVNLPYLNHIKIAAMVVFCGLTIWLARRERKKL